MRLSTLLRTINSPSPSHMTDPEITDVTLDSRKVKPGALFAALPGAKQDGRQFVQDALAKGAAAILAPTGSEKPDPCSAVWIETKDPRRLLAHIAAAFFEKQPRHIVAVTGTNGKSSTVHFARSLWGHLGHKAASLGTLGLQTETGLMKGSLTTPDPIALHQDLAMVTDMGITHLAMEASSHGLDQFRLDGVRLQAAAFTNLTRDHLDYHGTMDAYAAAKARLFQDLLPTSGTAVLNMDSDAAPFYAKIAADRGCRVIGYGEAGADLQVHSTDLQPTGQSVDLTAFGTRHKIFLPLVGRFQLWNTLAALGLVVASGDDASAALAQLEKLDSVRGRLECVAHVQGAGIYVDYAHTPDALETVLNALRPHTDGKLCVVFGCGGDRDKGKRPLMGAIAARLADKVFVTDDNPRTEIAATIRQEIMAACPTATEIGDRQTAIEAAISGLRPGDTLLIAGKGHESGQIVGAEVLPFDDADVARSIVQGFAA
jgi:UDP-N-acetylmuramoyl-L-alanyl-D-glutamate--2,6-diaminopimelate ligase